MSDDCRQRKQYERSHNGPRCDGCERNEQLFRKLPQVVQRQPKRVANPPSKRSLRRLIVGSLRSRDLDCREGDAIIEVSQTPLHSLNLLPDAAQLRFQSQPVLDFVSALANKLYQAAVEYLSVVQPGFQIDEFLGNVL